MGRFEKKKKRVFQGKTPRTQKKKPLKGLTSGENKVFLSTLKKAVSIDRGRTN